MNHTYTTIIEHDLVHLGKDEVIIVCNDCGALTTMGHELMIEHFPCCVPGEGKHWEEYYRKCEDEEYRI